MIRQDPDQCTLHWQKVSTDLLGTNPHKTEQLRLLDVYFVLNISLMEIRRAQVVVSRTTNYTGGNNMIICSQEQRTGNYHNKHIDIQNKGMWIKIDTREAWE